MRLKEILEIYGHTEQWAQKFGAEFWLAPKILKRVAVMTTYHMHVCAAMIYTHWDLVIETSHISDIYWNCYVGSLLALYILSRAASGYATSYGLISRVFFLLSVSARLNLGQNYGQRPNRGSDTPQKRLRSWNFWISRFHLRFQDLAKILRFQDFSKNL